ncbi:MAG: citrate lyase acyl carrier protein [Synergistaceae bacterium]|nr:citrate lyase acyl carrier protein [Synergistaceae bacterium]
MIRERRGQAGSLESCDALVIVELSEEKKGILLELDSPSLLSYEEAMKSAVIETLCSLGVADALVKIQDRGSLDCTLRARVETAARRALAFQKHGGTI